MIRSFLEAWSDPQMRHAMVVHFPVVLSLITIPPAVLAALWQGTGRGRVLQWITLTACLMLAASLFVAGEAGEDAKDAVGPLSEAGEQELEEHEEDGENLWIWGAALCAVAGVGFVRVKPVRIGSAWLVVAGGLVMAACVAETADHGGRLVYVHGAAGSAAPASSGGAEIDDDDDPAGDPRLAFFRSDVRPLLVENCLRCHNPARLKRAGQLNLTTIAGVLAGGESGAVIVPGRPDESLLIAAVRWGDPDLEMPRGEDKLPDDKIAVLEKWIADGVAWEAFEYTPPPRRERGPGQ